MKKKRTGATLATLLHFDDRLAAKGHPRVFAPGSWWRKEASAFYGSGAPEWWVQAGRGSAKSTVIYRVAENETIAGEWLVPPGERQWGIIKSKSKEEASKALGIIACDLTDLGVAFDVAGDAIELVDMPRGIRVTAASVGANSGWRAYFDANDEVAKWPSDGAQMVDAEETIASGRAMTIMHPGARRLYFSSALTVYGIHADTVAKGSSVSTHVSLAPSWVANPTITEKQCRLLEPNPRIFAREYGNKPSATAHAVFPPEDVDRAFDRDVEIDTMGHPVLVIDASRGRKDAFAWIVARAATVDGREQVVVEVVDSTKAGFTAGIDKAAAEAKHWGIWDVFGDPYEAEGATRAFREHGLRFHERNWGEDSKSSAVETLARWLNEDTIILPQKAEALKQELYRFEEKINRRTGSFTYAGRGSSHDDTVACLLTLAMVRLPRAGAGTRGAPASPEFTAAFIRRQIASMKPYTSPHFGENPPPFFDDDRRNPFGELNSAYVRSLAR